MNPRNAPAIAEPKLNAPRTDSRPTPPRPANSATTTKARPVLRAQSEPPPGDSTQTYDQRELSRLLIETDPSLAQDVLDRAFTETSVVHARAPHDKPTVRPPALLPLSQSSIPLDESAFRRARSDTLSDREEVTVAYGRPAAPSSNATLAVPTTKQETPPTFQAALAEPTVNRPFHYELEADDDDAHQTGPKQRPASLRPPTPRKSKLKPWLLGSALLSLGLLVAATAMPVRFGKPGRILHAQYAHVALAVARIQRNTSKPAPTTTVLPRLVDLNIVADPPQAKIYLDGHEASNPLKVAYPADNSTHELRAVVEGREPKNLHIKFDRDVSVVIGL